MRHVTVPKWLNNQYTKALASIFIFLTLLDYFGAYGLVGFVAAFTIYTGIKILIQRENYLNGLRYAEIKIFGKPLDRENWEKKELKETKFKFVWNKNKKKNKKGQSYTIMIVVCLAFFAFFLLLWGVKNFMS